MPISELTQEQLSEYTKTSYSWKDLMNKCGYTNLGCRTYLKKKLQKFNIDTSHFIKNNKRKRYTDEEIFKENSDYNSMTCIKNRLIKYYNWEYKCSSCKLSEWMGQKIPIEIDHINGNHTDNRIDNLRFLCPNCHALTDTYKGKNIKNKENYQEMYHNIKINTTCPQCGNKKNKDSQTCKLCFYKRNTKKTVLTSNNKKNSCRDCNKPIQSISERCIDCYKLARKNGIHERTCNNYNKKCPDCDKMIPNKSLRCRLCNYSLLKSTAILPNKERTKGQCIDCKTKIDICAVRCIVCSRQIIENANNNISNNCNNCSNPFLGKGNYCKDCYSYNTPKIEKTNI
jgi:hypothetical protein